MSSRGYAQFIEVKADAAAAWRAFTEEPMLRRWYAREVLVEPHLKGAFRVRVRDGRVRDAIIDVWEPGKRLRLIYFPDPEVASLADDTAGPLVEDVLFDTKPGRTVVRVFGSGVPEGREWDAYYSKLRLSWAYWLHELKRALEEEPQKEAS